MSNRELDSIFRPRSIVLVGASDRPGSVGAVVTRNLLETGFHGPVFLVNPRHDTVHNLRTYANVVDLPITPDLAVIATPPTVVPEVIADLARKNIRACIVITAGIPSAGEASLRLQLHHLARLHGIRIVGPNCFGIMAPRIGLNATFAHLQPAAGKLAFVTQSGAIMAALLDWAAARGIGFSRMVSLGDMADIDFGDIIGDLSSDTETEAILLYIEAVGDAHAFMEAARACSRTKPILAIKAGRRAEGARAATTHTGALAGADAVYDAAFARAGISRLHELGELFGAAEALAWAPPLRGEGLVVVSNGGGAGVLAIDALIEAGGKPTVLSARTIARLDAILPPQWSRANPVDLVGDANAERFASTIAILADDAAVHAVLVIACPTALASGVDAARAVIAKIQQNGPAVLTCWVGEKAAAEGRSFLTEFHVPSFAAPEDAVRGFMHLVQKWRGRAHVMEMTVERPEPPAPNIAAADATISSALAVGRLILTEPESKAVLAAYGIQVIETRVAHTPDEAASIASQLAGPVALKILSPDVTHKTEVGGVALELGTPAEVARAANRMLKCVRKARPGARIEGFTLQPMVNTAAGFELILGMSEDPEFGPILLFGHGGTAAEIINDTALALPPLNLSLAREAMTRTRIYRLLQGFRGRKSASIDAIAAVLVKLSKLVADRPEIAEIEINPLFADEHGAVALDARIRVARPSTRGLSEPTISSTTPISTNNSLL